MYDFVNELNKIMTIRSIIIDKSKKNMSLKEAISFSLEYQRHIYNDIVSKLYEIEETMFKNHDNGKLFINDNGGFDLEYRNSENDIIKIKFCITGHDGEKAEVMIIYPENGKELINKIKFYANMYYKDFMKLEETNNENKNITFFDKNYNTLQFPFITKKENDNYNFKVNLEVHNNIVIFKAQIINKEDDISCITIKYDNAKMNYFECTYQYSYIFDGKIWTQTLNQEEINYILNNLYIPTNYFEDSILSYMDERARTRKDYIERREETEVAEISDLRRFIINEKINKNKELIEELIKENQELAEQLKIKLPILREELLDEINDSYDNYYIIKDKYKKTLRNYDLSKISFDNVDIRGIDFRGTNINSSLFDLQKIHDKDASNCNFSTDEDNAKDYIFGYDTDFTGVNLRGTDMSNPYPCLLNPTINKAYIDEFTILPGFYQDKVKKENFVYALSRLHYIMFLIAITYFFDIINHIDRWQ